MDTKILGTIPNVVSLRGWFSEDDFRNNVIVGTSDGNVHYMFWKGHDSFVTNERLPLSFDPGTIVSVSGYYSTDGQFQMVMVATTHGKVHEIFFKSTQTQNGISIEGHDDLPGINFSEPIVGVSGHFSLVDARHLVVVGTQQRIHEIFWRTGQDGIEGHDDVPVDFGTASIHSISSHYNPHDGRENVIVGKILNNQSAIDWIFWQPSTVGVEDFFTLPINFASLIEPVVSSFYSVDDQRHHVVFVDRGEPTAVTEIIFASGQHSIELQRSRGPGGDGSGVGGAVAVSGYYNPTEKTHNVIVANSHGDIRLTSWNLGE